MLPVRSSSLFLSSIWYPFCPSLRSVYQLECLTRPLIRPLASFASRRTRWCKLPLTDGRIFVADVGALHVVGFQHRNFDERSLLGLNLYVDV